MISILLLFIIIFLLYKNNKIKKNKDDGFENYLIKSRNDAYLYIEQTQEILKKFIDDLDRDIEYFEKYGDIMGIKPNYELLEKISKSYRELKILLPNEGENK